jgi:hypothetical protein
MAQHANRRITEVADLAVWQAAGGTRRVEVHLIFFRHVRVAVHLVDRLAVNSQREFVLFRSAIVVPA